MKKPYILYKRQASEGWQAGFLDPATGRYARRRSLRDEWGKPIKSETRAHEAARKLLDTLPSSAGDVPATDYLRDFWSADSAYVQRRAAAGHPVSEAYRRTRGAALLRYAIPYLEAHHPGILLSKVLPGHIEAMLMQILAEGNRRASSVNDLRRNLSSAFADAVRIGIMRTNPVRAALVLAETRTPREILSPDEVRAFFRLPWRDHRLYAVNLLAATTGMRFGECLGLQREDVHDGWVHVCHNWQTLEGVKPPKYGSIRDVPIPQITQEAIAKLIESNPWGSAFVFYGSSRDHPVVADQVRDGYNLAVNAIGICEAERVRRGLTFHAWRHWYNSMLRGHVADHALRALTGHRAEAMTERYSHVTAEQRAAVKQLAEGLV